MQEKSFLNGHEFNIFVTTLLGDELSVQAAPKALAPFAEKHGIGRVDMEITLSVKMTSTTGEERHESILLYEDPAGYGSEHVWTKEYSANERGSIVTRVYPRADIGDWSDADMMTIDTIISVLILHVARSNLLDRLQKSSVTNYLTMLPNSGGFLDRVGRAFAERRISEYNAYYFNLKGTGLLNVRYGPTECDWILRRYADLCRAFVLPDECIGHLGGDNFVAMIRKDREDAFASFLAGAETYAECSGAQVPIIIRTTCGMMRMEDSLPGPWMVMAGIAVSLNYARQHNLNLAELTPQMMAQANRQKEIQQGFNSALRNRDFETYYQLKVDIRNNRIVGTEVLSRWKLGDEIVGPSEYIPVLEQAGLVEELDLYVLEEACKNLRKWKQMGRDIVPMSVNFSRRDLCDPRLAEKIIDVIRTYQVDRNDILIEITETTSEREKEMMLSFLRQMDAYRIATSIDDFGTGYSSLSALRDYPVSEIKIDRSFINHSNLKDKDKAIIGSIIDMANRLHVDVITEGVENMEQVALLKDLGCNRAQGFLYGRPLPKEKFEKMLEQKYIEINGGAISEQAVPEKALQESYSS
uniref:bifunctional diguanylate cyclase/phosphodiesterase n=1 Tax=Eubacterium cellulosolvens TaxID=29322 RepID=UPI00068682E0|nr:bifunctional diguanylate cyclase/phosphodiesterase [[Eubacterium] cellulosolvens]